MTISKSYITKLRFGFVVYNHLGSLPLITSYQAFKDEFY